MSDSKECKKIIARLAQYHDLGTIEKTRADLHLKRCESCSHALEGLKQIESLGTKRWSIARDQADYIYDRLALCVNELSNEYSKIQQPQYWTKPLWGLSMAAAAAAIAIIFSVLFWKKPPESSIANFTLNTEPNTPVYPSEFLFRNGRIDRLQGAVLINDKQPQPLEGRFEILKDTKIKVGESSRVNFRMGNFVKVALRDNSIWSVKEISRRKITLNLSLGRMSMEYDSTLGRTLEIITPQSVITVTGTIFTVEVFEDGSEQVGVINGSVNVKNNYETVSLSNGELFQVSKDTQITTIGDEQRILAAEVSYLEDNFVTPSGRLVSFTSSQDHVIVEIEGQFLGYTPLTVRLPFGPINYKLIKPGMNTVEAQLVNEQVSEEVSFTLEPSSNYIPQVVTKESNRSRKQKEKLDSPHDIDKESKDYIIRARAAMTAGNLPFAVELLEKISKRSKGEQLVNAISLLAECHLALGNYKEAVTTFERVARLTPSSSIGQNAMYEVGRISMEQTGDFNRARRAFTSYVASPLGGQLQEDAYFSICELYGREGQRKNALQCFGDYLRMYPDGHKTPFARLWRGVLYQELEQRWIMAERDLVAFTRARPRHPRCEEARYRIALGRYHLGDYKGVMEMFEEYMHQHPGGQYRIRIERLKEAVINGNDNF